MKQSDFDIISIVHETKGRIRLRVAVLGNPSLDTEAVEISLLKLNGVNSVRINPYAKSIAVNYDVNSNARQLVVDAFSIFSISFFTAMDEIVEKPDLINVYWSGTMWILGAVLPRRASEVKTMISAMPTILEGANVLINEGLKVEVLDAVVLSLLLSRKEYFTVGTLVFLLNLGHYLEESTKYQSLELLKSLVQQTVDEVWILEANVEKKINIDEVKVGDIVVIGAGEMIAVDGNLYSGEGQVDQSSLTGESLPVIPELGDMLYAGTVVVEGRLLVKAEKVGAETSSARIAEFITKSLKRNSKMEIKTYKMADKMVPITFLTGLAAWALTGDIKRASSVLAVDYSCALKLATPTAIKASMFRAAKKGVLIKGASALENLSEVDIMIFDKTGTLTKGALKVTEIRTYNGFQQDELLRIAASAEEHYSHPIADAVVREALHRDIILESVGEVNFIIAHGVSAYVGDLDVKVGSYHFVAEDEGIDCSSSDVDARKFQEAGNTVLYVVADDQLIGIIAMRDEPRPEARETIQKLKEVGIKRTVMLTGDSRIVAQQIAKDLQIDDVYYELKPEEKADIVKLLTSQGHKCAYIGDGVNDGPALINASVGISLPKGSDLARDAAQVLLLKEDLQMLIVAKQIADETMRAINHVFVANVGVNTVTVILAMMGFLSPLTASMIHNGTTVSTLMYAMNLAGNEKDGLYRMEGKFKKTSVTKGMATR